MVSRSNARAVLKLSAVAALVFLVGCYSLQPAMGTIPQPGNVIGLDINDAGRVALGGSMGPEIIQLEGRLISRDASEYVVGVSTVRLLRGGEQVWRGEAVHIKKEFVSVVYERKLSKTRTIIAGAAGVGLVALIGSRSLGGLWTPEDPPGQSDTVAAQRRPPR